MKKKIIALIVFGILLIVVGSAGSAYYYNLADKEIRTTTRETFKVKNEKNTTTLELTIQGNIPYAISSSDDDQFHLNSETFSKDQNSTVTWLPQEADGKTTLAVDFNRKKRKQSTFTFGVDVWEGRYEYINLNIPKSYEKIHLKTNNSSGHKSINVSDLNAKSLTFDNQTGTVHLYNVNAETITADVKRGGFEVYNTTVEKDLDVTSDDGYLSINDTRAPNFSLKTKNNDISASDLIGDGQITSDHGDINLASVAGKINATTKNGDISWNLGKPRDDMKLETVNGDIYVYLHEVNTKLSITGKSKTGNVTLFGKETENFSKTADAPHLELTTLYGDINVDSDENDYYEE